MTLDLDRRTWTRVALGDVARASKKNVDPSSGEVDRYVGGDHMDTDDLKLHRWGDVGDGYLGPAFHRRFHPGQVLYGSRRTYLRKVAVADFAGVTANTTFVVETSNENVLRQDFLPFVMNSAPFHSFSVAESKGSVNPYVNWSDIAKYEFDLPPLELQERLANLFWAAEWDKRSSAELSSAAEGARAGLRDCIFARLTADTASFDSLCSIPSQNGVALKKDSRAGDVPMVNMGEMFREEVLTDLSRLERVDMDNPDFLLKSGDLLFARRSIVFEGAGQCCLVPSLTDKCTFESSVIRSTPDSKLVEPHYLLHYFRSSRGRRAISRIVRRGPVSGVSGSDLRRLEVPVAPLEDQRNVLKELRSVESEVQAPSTRLDSVRRLVATISVDVFGGAR